MATGTLTGQTIANTYKALLKITGTTAGGETLHATTQKVIEDGDGNPFPFSAAQDAILMTGTSRLEFNDNGEYISGDGTDLTITSGADIILAGTAVNITADTIDLSDATKDVTLNAAVDALNFDSNTLSIDATNNRIGIGTAAPDYQLHIESTASAPTLELRSTITPDGSKTGGQIILGLHQENASGSGANETQDGDILGEIGFQGQGYDYTYAGGKIRCEVQTGASNNTRTQQGTEMSFWTMDTSGAANEQRMTIDQDGNVGIGASPLTGNSIAPNLTVEGTKPAVLIKEAGRVDSFLGLWADVGNSQLHFDDSGQFAIMHADDAIGTNSTAVATFAAGGDVTVNTGNLVIGTAGKGIDFSNAADTATGETVTSSLLDDYEEGKFDFAATSASGTIGINTDYNQASYVKIGSIVHFQARLHNNTFSGGDGAVTFTGLPFTSVASLTEQDDQCPVLILIGNTSANGAYAGLINEGVTTIIAGLIDADTWDNDVDINLQGTYRVA